MSDRYDAQTQLAQHVRQQRIFNIIRKTNPENAGTGQGIEFTHVAQRCRHGVEGRGQGELYIKCSARWLHGSAHANEQRVIEKLTQPTQGGTDRRLAEKQFLTGAGKISFVHQRFENDQKTEVDFAQIVSVHRHHQKGCGPSLCFSAQERCSKGI
jgi:hypothetical protein